MATAKQIAWRKKFAALAKAGKLTKKRKASPARKVAAKSIKSPSARKYPSKYGNGPAPRSNSPLFRVLVGTNRVGAFWKLTDAKSYAQALADSTGKSVSIERMA
jgi:uncharacterized protein (DUF736 family)